MLRFDRVRHLMGRLADAFSAAARAGARRRRTRRRAAARRRRASPPAPATSARWKSDAWPGCWRAARRRTWSCRSTASSSRPISGAAARRSRASRPARFTPRICSWRRRRSSAMRAAVAKLRRIHRPVLAGYLRHIDVSPAFFDEVEQRLWDAALVGTAGAPPKLMSYSGQGALAGWVGIAAQRIALMMRRHEAAEERAVDGVAVRGRGRSAGRRSRAGVHQGQAARPVSDRAQRGRWRRWRIASA